jgi:ABC-type nitrate/sulfonate/bicarbonate transport system permease component
MDVILPYVAVITVTGFLVDQGLRMLNRHAFPWYEPEGGRGR